MKQRQQDIIAAYRAGETYQQIGDRYGITRERVRQIMPPEMRDIRSGRSGRAAPAAANALFDCKTACLYLCGRGGGLDPIKIGYSANIKKRRQQIQTGYPEPIKMLWAARMALDHAKKLERLAHREFGKIGRRPTVRNSSGEWFYQVERGRIIEKLQQALVVLDIPYIVEVGLDRGAK